MSVAVLAIDRRQSFTPALRRSPGPHLHGAETRPCEASLPAQANNMLLTALPALEYQRLLPHLEPVPLRLGQTLYEASSRADHVFFPTAGMVSLAHLTAQGESSELAVVGNEGVLGFFQIFGGETSWPYSSVVYGAGHALRIPAAVLRDEFERCGVLCRVLLRHTQVLMTHVAQTAVCNRHHTVEQQLCRLLLLSLDRLPSNQVVLTQELIGRMLGVRREGVNEAAMHLQQAGVIRYRRGHITVLDRPKLERRVCECYAVVKREHDRLFAH
jgi:CRP-like cAMP-binding protein